MYQLDVNILIPKVEEAMFTLGTIGCLVTDSCPKLSEYSIPYTCKVALIHQQGMSYPNIIIQGTEQFSCLTYLSNFILTLLQKYLYHQGQYLTKLDSKCVALIAEMARALAMNRLGVRVPLRSKHFLSKKLRHLHNNIRL